MLVAIEVKYLYFHSCKIVFLQKWAAFKTLKHFLRLELGVKILTIYRNVLKLLEQLQLELSFSVSFLENGNILMYLGARDPASVCRDQKS